MIWSLACLAWPDLTPLGALTSETDHRLHPHPSPQWHQPTSHKLNLSQMTSNGEALALFDIDDDELNHRDVTTHLAPLASIQMPTFPLASLSPTTSKTHIRPVPGGHSPLTSPLPSPTRAGFGFGVTGQLDEVSSSTSVHYHLRDRLSRRVDWIGSGGDVKNDGRFA